MLRCRAVGAGERLGFEDIEGVVDGVVHLERREVRGDSQHLGEVVAWHENPDGATRLRPVRAAVDGAGEQGQQQCSKCVGASGAGESEPARVRYREGDPLGVRVRPSCSGGLGVRGRGSAWASPGGRGGVHRGTGIDVVDAAGLIEIRVVGIGIGIGIGIGFVGSEVVESQLVDHRRGGEVVTPAATWSVSAPASPPGDHQSCGDGRGQPEPGEGRGVPDARRFLARGAGGIVDDRGRSSGRACGRPCGGRGARDGRTGRDRIGGDGRARSGRSRGVGDRRGGGGAGWQSELFSRVDQAGAGEGAATGLRLSLVDRKDLRPSGAAAERAIGDPPQGVVDPGHRVRGPDDDRPCRTGAAAGRVRSGLSRDGVRRYGVGDRHEQPERRSSRARHECRRRRQRRRDRPDVAPWATVAEDRQNHGTHEQGGQGVGGREPPTRRHAELPDASPQPHRGAAGHVGGERRPGQPARAGEHVDEQSAAQRAEQVQLKFVPRWKVLGQRPPDVAGQRPRHPRDQGGEQQQSGQAAQHATTAPCGPMLAVQTSRTGHQENSLGRASGGRSVAVR